MSIDIGDNSPFQSYTYRFPVKLIEPVKDALDILLSHKIIEPCSGPWSSPILPVLKKDGSSIHICIDFRWLNAITKPDPYLMPRVDTILDFLGTSSFLSKFDLVKGFHQVPVKLRDRPKTGFVTPWGKYQYSCMPFGLRNAPAVFQRQMDIVLYDVFVYCRAFDDIVVFSSSWEEHVCILNVLCRLSKKLV